METETFVAVDDAGNRVPVQVVRSGDNLVIFLNEGQSIEGVTEALTQGMADGGQGQYQIMVTDNYQEGQQIENIQQAEGYEQIQEASTVEEMQPVIGAEPVQTVSSESYQQYQVDQLVQGVQPVQVESVLTESTEPLGAFVPAVARGQESEGVNAFVPAVASGEESEGVNAFVPAVASGEESEGVHAFVPAVGSGEESEGVNAFVSAVASGEDSEGVNAFVSAVASGFQEPIGGGHPISNLANVNIPIDSNFQLPVNQFDQNSYVPVVSSVGTSHLVAGQIDQNNLPVVNAESGIGTDSIVASQFDQNSGAAVESGFETQSHYEQSNVATTESGVGTSDMPDGALEIDLSRKPVAGAAPQIEVITSIDDLIVSQPLTTNTSTLEQVDKPFIATRVVPAKSNTVSSFVSQKPATQTTVKIAPVSKTATPKSSGVSILLKCEKCDQVFFTASELKAHRDRVHAIRQEKEIGKIPSIVVDKKTNSETELTGTANKNLCSICHIICPSLHALIKHKHDRHGMPMPFKCESCNYSTTQKKYLDVHMRTHKTLFNCKICQSAFDTEDKLNKHVTQHARDKYQCFYCSKMYLTRKACTDHIALKHSAPQKTDAPVTKVMPESIKQSEATAAPPPPVASNESSSQTEMNTNLLEDLDHSEDELATQTAELLDMKDKEVALDTPVYTEEQELDVSAIADDYVMDTDEGVDKDVAEKEETDVDIKMETVSKTDPQKPPEGLEDFTPIKNRDFQCLACYSEFPTELLFQNHYLKDHTQENSCLVCGRDFTKRFLLRCHFQETHCCMDVYRCKNCDRVFNMVQKYWKHALIHARKYVCNTCDKAFGIPSELKRHQMSVHAEKTYFCVYCPEIFTSAVDLRKHKDVAHNMKSYIKKDGDLVKGEPAEGKQTSVSAIGSSAKSLIQQAKDSGSQMTIKIFRDGTYMTTDPNTGKSDYGTIDLSNLGLDPALLQTHNDLELVIIPPDKEEETLKEKQSTVSLSESSKPSPVTLIKNTANAKKVTVTKYPVKVSQSNQTPRAKLKGTFRVEKTEDLESSTVYRKQIVPEGRSFSCSYCPRTFRFYRHLRCHENAHGRSEKYECHICQRMFVRETNLKLHLDLHKKKDLNPPVPKKPRTPRSKTPDNFEKGCDICGKVFRQKYKLNRHIKEVHESSPIECHICQKSFRTESNAQRHMKTHFGPFPCTYCTEIFKSKEEVNTHVKELHQMKLHTCHVCNKDLFSFGKLLSHLKLIHPDNKDALQEVSDSLKCDICQKKFSSAKSVRIHKMTHTGEKKYQCPHCPWKFYLSWKLKRHMTRVHENATPTNKFPCEMCMKEFFKKEALQNHEAKAHPAPYKCQLCNAKKFIDKEQFKKHCEEKHSGNCVKCNLCELSFASGRFLNIHQTQTHVKSYLCDLCGYAFDRKDEMHKHLKFNHFGGDEEALNAAYPNIDKSIQQTDFEELRKTLQCTRCGKTFKKFNGLMCHMKSCDADSFMKEDDDEVEDDEVEDEEKVDTLTNEAIEYKKLRNNPTCTTCKKTFKNLAAVVSHMRYCGKIKQPAMKLPVKIQKISSPVKKERKENEADMTEDNEYVPFSYLETGRYVTCDQCQKTFSKRESLRKHLLVHAGIKRKPDKDKSVTSKVDRKVETAKGQEIESKTADNDSLDSKSQGKNAGKRSKKVYDVEKKKCEICNISFTALFSLKRHIHKRHPEAGIHMDSKLGTEKVKWKKGDPNIEPKTEEEISQQAKNQFLEMNFSLGIKTEPSSDLNSPVVETVKTKRHDCILCGTKFSREATLKKHLAELHDEEEIEPESDSSSDSMETEEIPSSPVKTRHMLKTDISKPKIKKEDKEVTPKPVGKTKIKKEDKELTPKPVASKTKIKKEDKELTPKPVASKTKSKKEDKDLTPKPVGGKTKIKKLDKGLAQKTDLGKTKIKKEKEEKGPEQKVNKKKVSSDLGKTKIKTRSTPKVKIEGKTTKASEKKELFKCKHCDRTLNSKLRLDRHLRYSHKDLKGILSSLTSIRNLRSQKTFHNLRVKKKLTTFQKPKPKNKHKTVQQPNSRSDQSKAYKTKTGEHSKADKTKTGVLQRKNETHSVRELQQKSQNKMLARKQSKPKGSIKTVSGSKAKHALSIKKPATNLKQSKIQVSSPSVTKKQIKNQKSTGSVTRQVKKTSSTSILGGILSQFLKKRISMILYECEFCDKQFSDKLRLNFHRRTKHGSKVISKSICVCNICGESFSELRTLITHTVSVHSARPVKDEKTTLEEISESHIAPTKMVLEETDLFSGIESKVVHGFTADTNENTLMEPDEDGKHKGIETALFDADDLAEKDHVATETSKMDDLENFDQLREIRNHQEANHVLDNSKETSKQLETSVDDISEALVLENDLTSQYIELQNNKGQHKTQKESEDNVGAASDSLIQNEGQMETEVTEMLDEEGKDGGDGLKDNVYLGTETEQVMNEKVNNTASSQLEKVAHLGQNGECHMEIDTNIGMTETAEGVVEGESLTKEFEDPVVHDVDMFTGNIVSDDKDSKRAVDRIFEGTDEPLNELECTITNDKNVSKEKLATGITIQANSRQCPTCLKKFSTETGYSKHIHSHTEKKYECKDCDAVFRWKKNYESHWRLFHTEKGGLVCQICNHIFYDQDDFDKHQAIHLAKKFSCTVCKKKFSKHSILKDHITEIHKNPQLQRRAMQNVDMICTVCNVKCSTTEKLLNHMLLLHSPRKPAKLLFRERMYKYKCKFCPLMFKTKESQKSHLKTCDKRTVLAKKLFGCELTDNTCSVCGLKFRNKVSTFKHMQTAHGQSSKFKHIDFLKHPTVQNRYSCKNCNGTFAKFASYSMHEKSLYGICSKKKKSSKHERCPFCKVLFGSRLILGKHMLKVHNNYLYYSWKHCPYCKQSFARRLNLKKHMQAAHPERLNDGKKSAKKSHSAALALDQQASKKAVMQHVESTEKEHDQLESKYRKIRKSSGIERHKCDYCGRIHWTIDSFEQHLSKYHADRWIEKSVNSPGITNSPEITDSPTSDANEVVENAASDDNKLSAFPVVMVHRLPVDLLIKSSDGYVPEEKENVDKYLGVPYIFDADNKNEGNESGENVGKEIKEISDRSVEDLNNLPDLPLEQPVYCKTEVSTDVEINDVEKGQVGNDVENDIIDVNYLKLSSSAKASSAVIGVPESLPDEILAVTDTKTNEVSLKKEPRDEVESDIVTLDQSGNQSDSIEHEKEKAKLDEQEQSEQLEPVLGDNENLMEVMETDVKIEREGMYAENECMNESAIADCEKQSKFDQTEDRKEDIETPLANSEIQNESYSEETKTDMMTLKEFETEAVQDESENDLEAFTEIESGTEAYAMQTGQIDNGMVAREGENKAEENYSETVQIDSETAAGDETEINEMETVQFENENAEGIFTEEIETNIEFSTVTPQGELQSAQYEIEIDEMQI